MVPSLPLQDATAPARRSSAELVLCIDDELIGLKVRKILLERAGYSVLSALEGSEGIEIFTREPISAVVLDYAMPGMNGAQVAARMRQIKPEVPILLLSAYVGLPAEVTSLVNVYMTKGEGAPTLLKKLRAMLAMAQAS
jgi:CheY-like chemotaxis protein